MEQAAKIEPQNKVVPLTLKEKWKLEDHKGKIEIDHVALAEEIFNEISIYKNNVHYKYFDKVDGIWKEYAKQFLTTYIINKLGAYSKQKIVNETLFQLEGKYHQSNSDDPFASSNPYLVALKNGTLNLKTKEFKQLFEPKDFIRTKHNNISFDPEATCPKIENFLVSLVGEEHLDFIYEWFGFQLIRTYNPQAFLFLLGPGGTGKSTLLELLQIFISHNNTTNYNLETLLNSNKTYPIADLYGKSANICGDIDPKYMSNPGVFKSLTGNDIVTGDRKFMSAIHFRNYAKLTFSMNSLPALSDFTDGMKRRTIILPITRIIPKDEIKFNLMKEMTQEQELSGLLNKAIEGVHRILNNNWFSLTPTIQKEIDTWFEESDIVLQFLNEECQVGDPKDTGFFTRADYLFEMFDIYRNSSKAKEMTKVTFNKRLKTLGYPKGKKKLSKDKSCQAIFGVRLLEDERQW